MKKSFIFFLILLLASLPQISYGHASPGALKRNVKNPTQTTSAPANPTNQSNPTTTTPSAPSQTFTVGGVSFTMIRVEGGTFTMGATSEQGSIVWDDDKPAHQVTLSSYYIGETEVTQALWEAVMSSNPSYFKGANRPVENVSWNDCQTFISKLNAMTGKTFRLPTEAEWEYAARGGNRSMRYKYSGSNTIHEVGWYYENSGNSRLDETIWDYDKLVSNGCCTHPVKQKKANELGIFDMSGNVYEWCQDWEGVYSSSSQTNPTGPSSGSFRVNRGGGWINFARICRVSYRNSRSPDDRFGFLGLRLAL